MSFAFSHDRIFPPRIGLPRRSKTFKECVRFINFPLGIRQMNDIVIASAARTAVGSFGGSFANVPAHDLGSTVLSALVERAGLKKEDVQKQFWDRF